MALVAWIDDDLPGTATNGAGGLHAQDPRRLDDLASTSTLLAPLWLRSPSAATPGTRIASQTSLKIYCFLDAGRRFLQRQLDVDPDVGPSAAAGTSSKKIAEQAATKYLAEGGKDVFG
jgi:hypothetical protein